MRPGDEQHHPYASLAARTILKKRNRGAVGGSRWKEYNEQLADVYEEDSDRRIPGPYYGVPHMMLNHYRQTGERVIRMSEDHLENSWEHVDGGSPARTIEYWDGWTRVYAEGAPRFSHYAPCDPDIYEDQTGRKLPDGPREGGAHYGAAIPESVWSQHTVPA